MHESGHNAKRVVILTAISVEYEAVRAHLPSLRREKRGQIYYQLGMYATSNHEWEVIIRETGPGNVRAAVETLFAIQYFKPLLILFVGVAGGLKDVKLGDIVVPTQVSYYEAGRASLTSFQPRPQIVYPTHSLAQLAHAETKESDWRQQVKGMLTNPPPEVKALPTTSGESVVASTRSATFKFLADNFSNAVAVDMESYGFLFAASFYPEVQALAIRGISDRINNKKRTDLKNFQTLAADNASAFAFEILAKVDVVSVHDEDRAAGKVSNSNADYMGEDVMKPASEAPLPANSQGSTIEAEIEVESATKRVNTSMKFLKQVAQFKGDIRNIQRLFGEGQITFYDQCRPAINLIKALDEVIKERYEDATKLDFSTEFNLKKLTEQITAVLSDLNTFPRVHSLLGLGSSITEKQRNIHMKLDLLLQKVEQLEDLEQKL